MPTKSPPVLKLDPTRTTTLRRRFVVEARRRFAKLKLSVLEKVGTQDAFKGEWTYGNLPEKVSAFKNWLAIQVNTLVLGPTDWWSKYLVQGYLKGLTRSYDDATRKNRVDPKEAFGAKQEFIRQIMMRRDDPVLNESPLEKVDPGQFVSRRLHALALRLKGDLENVTSAMAAEMSRKLLDGLDQGKDPKELAKILSETIDKIGKTRADLIAHTECLLGDAIIDGATVRAVFRRWYSGPVIEVITRTGRKITATPNHPMLTSKGWLPISSINQGDYLIRNDRKQDTIVGDQNVNTEPTSIGQIFDSLNTIGILKRKPGFCRDFHGDGGQSEVEILSTDGELRFGNFTPFCKPLVQDVLSPADLSRFRFCGLCSCLLPIDKTSCLFCGSKNDSVIDQSSTQDSTINTKSSRYIDDGISLNVTLNEIFDRNVLPEVITYSSSDPRVSLPFGVSSSDPFFLENRVDGTLVSSHYLSNLSLSQSAKIEFDDVVNTVAREFRGHVYNLETSYGHYNTEGYYTGNCVRAHADGQLDALESLGVESVTAAVEWVTRAGACPACRAMDGVVLSVREARGMIPRHPRCRCSWIPANESTRGPQKKQRKQVVSAIRRSLAATDDILEEWGPAGGELDKERPKVTRNWSAISENVYNADCGTGAGGFKKGNTCSGGKEVAQKFVGDLGEYRKKTHPPGKRGNQVGRIRNDLQSPEAKRVLAQSKSFGNRAPNFSGASRNGVYFKWNLRENEDTTRLEIFRDWLMDEGYDAELVYGTNEKKHQRRRQSALEWARESARREGIAEDAIEPHLKQSRPDLFKPLSGVNRYATIHLRG